MGPLLMLYSVTVTYNFKIKLFELLFLQDVLLLSSNEIIANVVYHYIDLNLEGHEYCNVNISKTVRTTATKMLY